MLDMYGMDCLFLCLSSFLIVLKIRQSRNDFFKLTFLPKNEQTNSTLLIWYLRSTCFCSFFGRNCRHQNQHQNDISKLTDLKIVINYHLHRKWQEWKTFCLFIAFSVPSYIYSVMSRTLFVLYCQHHSDWSLYNCLL